MTPDTWNLTPHTWNLTPHTWHLKPVKPDMWHMVEGWTFNQNFSFLAHSLSSICVCRRALATPGLLKIVATGPWTLTSKELGDVIASYNAFTSFYASTQILVVVNKCGKRPPRQKVMLYPDPSNQCIKSQHGCKTAPF